MATVGSPVVNELVALTCLLGWGDFTLLPFLPHGVSFSLLLDVAAMLSLAGLPSCGLHTTGGSCESTVGWPVDCDPMAWTFLGSEVAGFLLSLFRSTFCLRR